MSNSMFIFGAAFVLTLVCLHDKKYAPAVLFFAAGIAALALL